MGRFSRFGPSTERVRSYVLVVAFAVLYVAVARGSISLLGSVGVSGFSGPVVWPASGLYVAALLVAERRLWPLLAGAALAGSLVAHLDAGSSLVVSLGFALPNAVEGLFAALLVRRGADRRPFERPGDIAALVLGGAVVGGGLLALSAAAVAQSGTSAPFGGSWIRWWSADGLGMLLVAPLVTLTREQLSRTSVRAEAATAVVVAGISVAAYVASAIHPWDGAGVLGAAVALPFALLAGWRWGPGGAVAAVLPVAIATGVRGAHDSTLFAFGSAASVQVLAVQGALAAVALATLIATTGAAQGTRLIAALADARDRLRRLLDLTSDACVSLDERGTIIAWNRQAEALFGWRAAEALEMNIYETFVAPSASEPWRAALDRETADGAVLSPIALPAWHRSGDELRVEVVVAPSSSDTGGADLLFRDVSERERLRSDAERLTGELAAKGRDLEAKGRDLERALREREQLRGNLARAHGQQAQTERELADRTHALASAKRRVEELEHELRSTIELRNRALNDARRQREALEQKLSALEGELSGAREATERLERELEESRRLRADTAAELDEARRLRVDLESELQHERDNRLGTEQELQHERDTRLGTEQELQHERDNRLGTEQELQHERDTRVETQAELERERHSRAETVAELERARDAQAEASAQLERTSERVAELERALADSQDRRTKLEAALASTQERVNAMAAELDEVRQQAADTERALEEAKLAHAAKEQHWLAERRRVESTLIATAKNLAAAQSNGHLSGQPDGEVTARYDGRGICLDASPAWRDAFGWDSEELVGQQGSRLIHSNDRPLLQRARAQRSESHFEVRIRNKQGGFTRAEVGFRPVRDHDDRLVQIEITLRPLPTEVPTLAPGTAAEAHHDPSEAKVRPPLRMV